MAILTEVPNIDNGNTIDEEIITNTIETAIDAQKKAVTAEQVSDDAKKTADAAVKTADGAVQDITAFKTDITAQQAISNNNASTALTNSQTAVNTANESKEQSQRAEQKAQSVVDRANAGEFKGNQGEQGIPGVGVASGMVSYQFSESEWVLGSDGYTLTVTREMHKGAPSNATMIQITKFIQGTSSLNKLADATVAHSDGTVVLYSHSPFAGVLFIGGGFIETEDAIARYDIEQLQASLATEATARAAADSTLQSNLESETTTRANADNALSARISAHEGLGGALNAHDFGTTTPTQNALTNYALSQIPTITDQLEIWNATHVTNLFDNAVWQLNNTQNTSPTVFEWVNIGSARVAQATQDTLGIVKGGDVITVNAQGELSTTPEKIGAAIKSEFDTHTGNTNVHITTAERTAWNGKASTAVATQSANGLMSSTDKTKLDGVETGAQKNTVTSENGTLKGVTNINVGGAIESNGWMWSQSGVYGYGGVYDGENEARVYSPNNKPSASDIGAAATAHTHTKSQITDFPTIPTVGNGTITINQGGVSKGSFTTNQSGNATISLDAGGSGSSSPYVKTISSWSGSVGAYTSAITAAVHGKGNYPSVLCRQNGIKIDCRDYVDSSGNVTVYSNSIITIQIEIR